MISSRVLGRLLAFFCSMVMLPAGLAQTVTLLPGTLPFGTLPVFTTSGVKKVTLSNTGTLAVTVTGIGITGPFAQTNNCVGTLAAHAKCTISLTFSPLVVAPVTGSLTVNDNAGIGTQTVALTGSGVAQITLTPSSIAFGSIIVGVPSAPKAAKLINNLSGPLSIASAISSLPDFAVQSGCGPQIPAKGSCAITVTFTPASVGVKTGTLTLNDSANTSPDTVKLNGTGVAVSLLSISVLPAAPSVGLHATQQFQALGNYNNGTHQDVTASAAWTSSSTAIATIGNVAGTKGLLTGVTIGTTSVSAKLGVVSGSTTATVVPVLTSIAVTPGSAEVVAGTAQQFTATGNYNNGTQANLTATVAWGSSNPVVASISASGLAATATPGQITVTASLGPIAGTAQLVVDPATLTSITVTPGIRFVGVGSNRQFTATGSFTDGTSKNLTSSVIWTSTNPLYATVDSFGLATSTGGGAANIVATAGTVSGFSTLSGVTGGFVDCDARPRDMKVLVVTNGQSEPDFPAITQALDYRGTPYTVFDMAAPGATIAPEFMANGCHGLFQGVIFTVAGNRYGLSGIGNVDTYEHDFQVRHLNWYSFPGTDFGLNAPTGSINAVPPTPYPATYTPDGAAIFPYANTANPLIINYSNIYLTTAFNGATPLLTDASGNALAVVYNPPWGSYQQLTLTLDSNPELMHDLVLSQGLVNWVTQGMFLGERHTYYTPQVDDYFIDDAEWLTTTPCNSPSDQTGATYRMNAADVTALVNWQTAKQSQLVTSNFVLHMAFNGFGAQPGSYTPDDLTPASQSSQAFFKWISHTFDHTNLDHVNNATATTEITQNNATAVTLGLSSYDPQNMVTPDISGLTNPAFLKAAVDNGIHYLVSDTSIAGYQNPTPNTGIPNPLQPSILMLPRHPNNLFFNVSIPDDWTAEYGCIYPQLAYNYQQILDNISDSFVTNMLKGDIDAEQFHQPNLRAYDGTHSLLGDLSDLTFTKYSNLVSFPILSPTENVIGGKMAARAQYNGAGVTASYIPHQRIMITAQRAVTVPVTGLVSATQENYGGQPISYVDVAAGQTVALPLP